MRQRTPATAANRDRAPAARSRWALLLAGLLGALAPALAPEALDAGADPKGVETETKVAVAYVYNFPKFIEWPDEAVETTAPIRICVVGAGPVGAMLDELSGREVKGRQIEVAHVGEADAWSACRLLYVTRAMEPRLQALLPRVEGAPVLTVSAIPRFAARGGMIGFVTEGGRVRIEINQRLLRRAGLRASAKVLEIARVVE